MDIEDYWLRRYHPKFKASEDQSYKWWYVLASCIAVCALIWLYSIIKYNRKIQQAKVQEVHREEVRNAQQQRVENETLQQLPPIKKAENESQHAQPENSAKQPPKAPSTAKFEEKMREEGKNVEKKRLSTSPPAAAKPDLSRLKEYLHGDGVKKYEDFKDQQKPHRPGDKPKYVLYKRS